MDKIAHIQDAIVDTLIKQGKASGLLEEGTAQYGDAYGLGKWPKAILLEVVTYEGNDYGYRLGLRLNLHGEDDNEMLGTFRFDLPRTRAENGHEVEAWQIKKEDDKRAVLNRGLAAIGLTSVVKKNIDSQEDYEAIASLFRSKVGSLCPAWVKADGKNRKVDDKWVFDANGFSKLDFLRRPKGK